MACTFLYSTPYCAVLRIYIVPHTRDIRGTSVVVFFIVCLSLGFQYGYNTLPLRTVLYCTVASVQLPSSKRPLTCGHHVLQREVPLSKFLCGVGPASESSQMHAYARAQIYCTVPTYIRYGVRTVQYSTVPPYSKFGNPETVLLHEGAGRVGGRQRLLRTAPSVSPWRCETDLE